MSKPNEDNSVNKYKRDKTTHDRSSKDLSDSSYNGKKKTDVSEISQSKTRDKSPNMTEDKRASVGVNSNSSVNTPDNASKDKRNRSRSPSILSKQKQNKSSNQTSSKKKMKKKVNFKSDKNFLEIISVESYKKYNIDNVYNEPGETEETTRCKCVIF